MITIIDTETKESIVCETFTDAAKIINIQAKTLRGWCKCKTDLKQRPWEVKNGYEIYFNTTFKRANTGFAIPMLR
jgi:hypothetical protein